MIKRKAYAVWNGSIKNGSGTVELGSGAFKGQYSFGSRFEEGVGTNPEELIGAAHAGCFSMALSLELSNAGYTVDEIATEAVVSLDKDGDGFKIPNIKLLTKARVPGIEMKDFAEFASAAKAGCPVSKALAGVEIQLEAHLLK